MKRAILITFLFGNSMFATGVPVVDILRWETDVIDNISELLDFAEQIQQGYEQISQADKKIEQMQDKLERYGTAGDTSFDLENLTTGDLRDILEEVDNYINGGGLTNEDQDANTEIYGEIDKEAHVITEDSELDPEKQYEKHENVEELYAAYKKTSASISEKRMDILDELEGLSKRLANATTDQEQSKLKGAIAAQHVMLKGLTDEEERAYRALQAEVHRNENARHKDRTRFSERRKYLEEKNMSNSTFQKLTFDQINALSQ
jgi:hypothetical protein